MRDWTALTIEWLTGKYASIKEFREKHGIPEATMDKQAKRHRWAESKGKMVGEARGKAIQSLADRIVSANEENFKAATTMLAGGLSKAREKGVNSAEQAISLGIKHRREALGQATETVELRDELKLTDEELAQVRIEAVKIARLRRAAHHHGAG